MGTCGIAAGGREVVKAVLEELKEQGVKDAALTQTGCAGLCRHEPLMEIISNDAKTTYFNVDRNKAKEIIKKHLVAGEIIEEWTNPPK
ncbi:MAG: (2Fe-2S) ferredoxin domain-containing protein [Firmicutes bacterium]|nr:(2Fe-2S) ferredoxin domain-containing protein [Bacillota bacterium]